MSFVLWLCFEIRYKLIKLINEILLYQDIKKIDITKPMR